MLGTLEECPNVILLDQSYNLISIPSLLVMDKNIEKEGGGTRGGTACSMPVRIWGVANMLSKEGMEIARQAAVTKIAYQMLLNGRKAKYIIDIQVLTEKPSKMWRNTYPFTVRKLFRLMSFAYDNIPAHLGSSAQIR